VRNARGENKPQTDKGEAMPFIVIVVRVLYKNEKKKRNENINGEDKRLLDSWLSCEHAFGSFVCVFDSGASFNQKHQSVLRVDERHKRLQRIFNFIFVDFVSNQAQMLLFLFQSEAVSRLANT